MMVSSSNCTSLSHLPTGSMAVAAKHKDPAQECVVFEDVAIYFSREEWGILNDAQRHLHSNVLLENVALLSSVGCWHGAKDEEVLSKQCVSVRVLQVTAPKPALSTLKAQPCKTCSSLLKDLLHLAEHDGTYPEQGLDTCAAEHDLHQKEQAREKLTRSDEWRPSFVNYSAHRGERKFPCTQGGRDFTASSDLLQQHVLNWAEAIQGYSGWGNLSR
ncbi:zinc finger protein 749 isoform X1 [Piliocolobus tephrosceles]|uniref:zinc finger protein 749 isoform X1 n=2 Tax=Piliocolobus tephrosceles TaxID=591936 RepID=UPI0013017B9C|nr:zinc finger protein 749 isoform X1 [Piliocolobus tephrosceles]